MTGGLPSMTGTTTHCISWSLDYIYFCIMDYTYVTHTCIKAAYIGLRVRLYAPIFCNYDMNAQVKHKRADLLKHPLVSQLLEYKWRRVALPLFLGYMAVYLLFLLMLTLFALLSPRPSPDSDTCKLARVLESR